MTTGGSVGGVKCRMTRHATLFISTGILADVRFRSVLQPVKKPGQLQKPRKQKTRTAQVNSIACVVSLLRVAVHLTAHDEQGDSYSVDNGRCPLLTITGMRAAPEPSVLRDCPSPSQAWRSIISRNLKKPSVQKCFFFAIDSWRISVV
jgi:hypothetical protein